MLFERLIFQKVNLYNNLPQNVVDAASVTLLNICSQVLSEVVVKMAMSPGKIICARGGPDLHGSRVPT